MVHFIFIDITFLKIMKKLLYIIPSIISILFLSACKDTLPKCDTKESKQLLSNAITRFLDKKRKNLELIRIGKIEEKGINKEAETRSCNANFILSDGQYSVDYTIYWLDKENSFFMVRLDL